LFVLKLRMIAVAILGLTLNASGLAAQAAIQFQIETRRAGGPELRSRFSLDQIAVLEALNRADAANLPRLDTLVIPDVWSTDLSRYSPFPQEYAWGVAQAKLLVVDQASQAFAAYEFGRQVRWGPVNTGRQASQTPAGLFHLNWRSPGRHSTVNPAWFLPWYYNIENHRGISFHQYALPGRPASHSCLRLLERDARWLYEWGEGWTLDARGWEVLEHGTPVLILGCYNFNAPPPWRSETFLSAGIQLPQAPSVAQVECGSSSR
jgi:hypothetical protein